MTRRHTILYLSARILAAILSLAAVVIFARLAGAAAFGTYLLILATSLVLNCLTLQWLRYALFQAYQPEKAADQIATYARIVLGMVGLASLIFLLVEFSGLMDRRITLAVFVIMLGMTFYDAMAEIGRVKLHAGTVALATVLRAAFTIVLGISALHIFNDPVALAIAVGLANLMAVVPILYRIWPDLIAGTPSREMAAGFLRYAWPLAIALAFSMIATLAERYILAAQLGAQALGPYGASTDFVRQGFIVIGEGLMMALVTLAKSHATAGRNDEARAILRMASRLFSFVAVFGIGFFVLVGGLVLQTLYGAEFVAALEPVVPWIVLSGALLMMRNYYLGQVIYFRGSARIELYVSIAAVLVVIVTSVLLIPLIGVLGAALSQVAGQSVACAAMAVYGRRAFQMPFDLKALIGMVAVVGALVLMAKLIETPGLTVWDRAAIDVAALSLAALGVIAWLRLWKRPVVS
jgi:O-antigen/teichoic acid export membrane protein